MSSLDAVKKQMLEEAPKVQAFFDAHDQDGGKTYYQLYKELEAAYAEITRLKIMINSAALAG